MCIKQKSCILCHVRIIVHKNSLHFSEIFLTNLVYFCKYDYGVDSIKKQLHYLSMILIKLKLILSASQSEMVEKEKNCFEEKILCMIKQSEIRHLCIKSMLLKISTG